MRLRTLITVAFLMMLYIGPMIFMSSYVSSATPTEQNMSKDFQVADSWLTGWSNRVSVNISGGADAGTNYQVMVTIGYSSTMQPDFDDIRFTDNDKTTLLDYWRESYVTSTSAVFWVEVADDLGSSVIIYMYYGNDAVSTVSSGDDTFMFFDDFENNNFNRWTDSTSDVWTITGATVNQGTYAAWANSNAGDRFVGFNFTIPVDYSFLYHADVRISTITSQYSYFCLADESNADDVYIGFTSSNDWATFDGGVVFFEENTVAADTWYEQEIAVDFEDTELQCWIDGNAKTTKPLVDSTDNVVADILYFKMGSVAVENFDLYVDEYYVRKWVNTEPVATVVLSWKVVATAVLIFSSAVDTAGLDMLLIIFGLVLIPLSSMYLVWGGKNAMSIDKFFYGLIVFFIGWGLFLGGIFI